jgi:prepilin-type N-terminal cleavage/methylation domain-containing protein
MDARTARGFSLIELLVVMAILMLVLGTVFTYIATMQRRYTQEEERTDMFQQAREALDQMARDLHEAGYPNYRQYAATVFGFPPGAVIPAAPAPQDNPVLRTSIRNAVGLASLATTGFIFEGDVDQDGTVDSVRYRVIPGPLAGFDCPCLQRSQMPKVAVDPTAQPGTNWQVVVENVIDFNFTAYDSSGAVVSSTLAAPPTAPQVALPNTNATSLMNVETLEVRMNVQGDRVEIDTGQRAQSSFVVTSRLPN